MKSKCDNQPLTIPQAAKRFPGNPHVSTMWRYVLTGLGGIKLETFKAGGKRLTTQEAIDRFVDATTARANGAAPFHIQTPKQREKAIERAERELERELD